MEGSRFHPMSLTGRLRLKEQSRAATNRGGLAERLPQRPDPWESELLQPVLGPRSYVTPPGHRDDPYSRLTGEKDQTVKLFYES